MTTHFKREDGWSSVQANRNAGDELRDRTSKASHGEDGQASRRLRKSRRKDFSVIKFRIRCSKTSLLPQASFLLSLHTIRLDPFSLCVTDLADPAVKAVFHRITTYFLPALALCCVDDSVPVAQTWLERANSSPVLYHAMLWGYSFPEYLGQQQRKVIDNHRRTAIKELIRLVDGETAASDEMLIAVALLSITEQSPEKPRSFGLFRPMLLKLQTIDIAGSLRFAEPHRSAVKRLVAERGGLGRISMAGVAEALQYWELFDSVFRLQPPEFELCGSYQRFLESKVVPLRSECLQHRPSTPPILKTAFLDLPFPADFQDLLLDMRLTCCLIVDFVSGNVAPPAKELAMHRNLIQYRVLKLQPQEDALAEICRIAALLFSFCVLFPWPDWSHKRMLAATLGTRIVNCALLKDLGSASEHWKREDVYRKKRTELEFLLWAAMIGAMTMDAEPSAFMDMLVGIADLLGLSEWDDVKSILVQYLWLDESCDDGGLTVWSEVMEKRMALVDIVGGRSMDLGGGSGGWSYVN